MPTTLAAHADVVGQLVDVVRPAREELRQSRADLGDGRRQRAADVASAEPLDHWIAHAGPVLVADAGENTLVTADPELSVLAREIDEHARAMGRLVHAVSREDAAGPIQPIP